MLKPIVTGLLLFSFVLVPYSDLFAAGELQTQKEKESYSIGYEVGRSMKADGVDVDFKILTQGLEDAINQQRAPPEGRGDEEAHRRSQEEGP